MKTFFMPILYRCGTKNCAGGGGGLKQKVFSITMNPLLGTLAKRGYKIYLQRKGFKSKRSF